MNAVVLLVASRRDLLAVVPISISFVVASCLTYAWGRRYMRRAPQLRMGVVGTSIMLAVCWVVLFVGILFS